MFRLYNRPSTFANDLNSFLQPCCGFWKWLNHVFNAVDQERIKEIGADRAAAEWLLRCGASVRWKGAEKFTNDYNNLTGAIGVKYIEAIDASESSISAAGCQHFKGLQHVKDVKLEHCGYMDDAGVSRLKHLKDSLEHLKIIRCHAITDHGLMHLKELKNLKTLELFNLLSVTNKNNTENELREALKSCEIDFPDDPK